MKFSIIDHKGNTRIFEIPDNDFYDLNNDFRLPGGNYFPEDISKLSQDIEYKRTTPYSDGEPIKLKKGTDNSPYPIDALFVPLLDILANKKENEFALPNKIMLEHIGKIMCRSYSSFEDMMNTYFSFGTLADAASFMEEKYLTGPSEDAQSAINALKKAFHEDSRFRGRVPGICDELALTYLYREEMAGKSAELPKIEEYASNFQLAPVVKMVNNGMPVAYIAMLYTSFPLRELTILADNPRYAQTTAQLLYKAEKSGNQGYKRAAFWIAGHVNTNESLIETICRKCDNLRIEKDDSVEAVETKIRNMKSMKNVEKLEEAYKKPGFKFEDVRCELKNVGEKVEVGQNVAYIMLPTDPRQVDLGNATSCCQTLNEAGESAMMHGLLNPRAGFWALEDKHSGKIKAQAEIWELNENTLVFDNIETANDADLHLYMTTLREWCKFSDYPNIIMGSGYNALSSCQLNAFKQLGPVEPPVTAYELYVMSYEENGLGKVLKSEEDAAKKLESGKITYYDYVYCDSCPDEGAPNKQGLQLKENGVLEPAFAKNDLSAHKASFYSFASAHSMTIESMNKLLCSNNIFAPHDSLGYAKFNSRDNERRENYNINYTYALHFFNENDREDALDYLDEQDFPWEIDDNGDLLVTEDALIQLDDLGEYDFEERSLEFAQEEDDVYDEDYVEQ